MNRPYRGLTKDGKWVYGWYFTDLEKHYIIDPEQQDISKLDMLTLPDGYILAVHEVIPKTVGHQIGLPDKNGVEIYAGDKVHIWSTFYKKDMPDAEVFWNEKAAKFDVKPADGQYHHWLAMGHHKGWFIEVIGNIHQEVKI